VSLAVPRIPPLSAGKTLGNGPIARKRAELTRCGASTVGVRTHPVWLCHADKQPRAHGSVPDAPEVFRSRRPTYRSGGRRGGGSGDGASHLPCAVLAFSRPLLAAARFFSAPRRPPAPQSARGRGRGAGNNSPVGRRGTPPLRPPPRRSLNCASSGAKGEPR